MADTSWPVIVAGLAGTVLGSGLQWAQGAFQARRERKRQDQGWSREDRRHWAERRQAIYSEILTIARAWISSLGDSYGPLILGRQAPPDVPRQRGGAWGRQADLLSGWNQKLVDVDFYGSEEVRFAVAKLDYTFHWLEEVSGLGEVVMDGMVGLAERTYTDCLSHMRRDLGLSTSGSAKLDQAREQVIGHLSIWLDVETGLAVPDRVNHDPEDSNASTDDGDSERDERP